MKPRTKLMTATTPDGGEIVLYQHDRDYSIMVNGDDLMHSRRHESELELAKLGCANLKNHEDPIVLIGGLGMGYTLRQTLDILHPKAKVVVAELLADIVKWNKEIIGDLAGRPLEDERVQLHLGDVVELIGNSKGTFDAIMLDIDNGPDAMTDINNQQAYSYQGIMSCRYALKGSGMLAVWSAKPSKDFERLLMDCGFHVSRYRVPAHKGKNPSYHFVWLASENKKKLPPGGGAPRPITGRKSKGKGKKGNKRS